MEHGLPDSKSDYADEGTKLHQAVHDGIDSPIGQTLDDTQRELVLLCEAQYQDRRNSQVLFENWFAVGGVIEGRPDCVTLSDIDVRIWDWKFGHNGISPSTIWQLKAQVLAVAEAYPGDGPFRATAFNPRTKEALDTPLYAREDLADLWDEVAAVVDASEADDAPLVPSLEACKYCKALAHCPAARAEIAVIGNLPEPAVLAPQEMSRAMDLRAMVSQWCDAVYDRAKSYPGPIPGWSLGRRDGNRVIARPELALERTADLVGVPEALALMKLPLGDFKALVVARLRAKGMALKEAEEEFQARMAGAIERGSPITSFRRDRTNGNVKRIPSGKPLAGQDGASEAAGA